MCSAMSGCTPSRRRAAIDLSVLHLSPCGRGIGRLGGRSRKRTPKQSFGYVASSDAIRVRGYALSMDRNPSPQPSPDERGSTPFLLLLIRLRELANSNPTAPHLVSACPRRQT